MAKNDLAAQIAGIVALAIVIIAVFGYAIIYFISVKLFPIFVVFYILFALATIFCGVMIYFNVDDEPGIFSILTAVFLVAFLLSMGGASITGNLIQSIPQTEEGRASLESWNDLWSLIGIPNYISNELDKALQQQLDVICESYDEDICQTSKSMVETYRNTQELQDWVNKGNSLIDFVEKYK